MECSELIETFSGDSHGGSRGGSYDRNRGGGGKRNRSGRHDDRHDNRDRREGHRDEHDRDWYWWRNYYGYGMYPWGLFNYYQPEYAINYPDLQDDYYPLDSRYGSNGGSPMMADSIQAMGNTGPMRQDYMNGAMAGRMMNPMQKIGKEGFENSMSMGGGGLILLIIIIIVIIVLISRS